MPELLTLSILGVVEAVVLLYRMRTAVGACRWRSAAATLAVTVTRILFVLVGASAALSAVPWWQAVVCYAIPATLATALVHGDARAPKSRA